MSSAKKNFIYNSLYELLVIAVPLVTTPYLARVLGPTQLGKYAYAYAIAYYFVMFMQLGMRNYGTRTIAKSRQDKSTLSRTFWELFSLQTVCALLAILAYMGYALYVSSNQLMALIMLPYLFSGALDITWCFSGLENFKIIVGRSTVIKVLTTACIFLFVKTSADVTKYALIMTGGMLLNQALLWPFLRRYITWAHVQPRALLKHLKPTLILFIPVVAVSIYKIMDKIMLGYMSNLTELGFYDSSEKVLTIPLALITSLGVVMLPHMSNLYATNNSQRTTAIFEKSIYFAMFLATSMGFGLMAVAKTFVPWFYGPEFNTCITLFQILLPSCMFLAFANVIRTQYLIPREKDRDYVISIIAGAVVNVVINWWLIPSMGAVGATIGTLCAEIAVCVIQAAVAYRGIPIKHCLLGSLPFVLAGVVMYVCILPLEFMNMPTLLNLFIQICIGTVYYCGLAGVLGLFLHKKYNIRYFT